MNKKITLSIVLAIIILAIVVLEHQKNKDRVAVTAGSADIPFLVANSTSTVDINNVCTDSYCTSTASTSIGTSSPAITNSTALSQSTKEGYLTPEQKLKKYPRAKELVSPDGFINTPPFKIQDEIGKKIILVDFWTYSCINCIRTLPYLNSWYKKYKKYGFEIVAVHTPEFDFEKDKTNVENAVKEYNIQYPVVQDNHYGTWNAYQNSYWPRKYLIDVDGFITFDHIGEGNYQDTEKKIQDALNEKLIRSGSSERVSLPLTTEAEALAPSRVMSPETYFGASRNEYLANGSQGVVGAQTLSVDTTNVQAIQSNGLYLNGSWDFQSQYAENDGEAKIVYKYVAKKVHFVAASDQAITVEVYSDGKFVKNITIKNSDLYTLIDSSDNQPHILEIRIPKAGLKAYTFTFS